jgi:hypothetical protein
MSKHASSKSYIWHMLVVLGLILGALVAVPGAAKGLADAVEHQYTWTRVVTWFFGISAGYLLSLMVRNLEEKLARDEPMPSLALPPATVLAQDAETPARTPEADRL